MSEKEKDSTVDLGLSGLLEGRTEITPAAQQTLSEPEDGITSLFSDIVTEPSDEKTPVHVEEIDLVEPAPEPEEDSYELLAREGKWEELRAAVEPLLGGLESHEELRLWWILSQLHLEEMPATVLCAPFDECVTELLTHDELNLSSGSLHARITVVTALLAERLEEAGEIDLCIATLERIYRIGHEASLGSMLHRLVSAELEKLPRRVTFHTPSEMKKRLHLLDLKREFEHERSTTFSLHDTSESAATSMPQAIVVEGARPSRLFLVAVLVILLGGSWLLWTRGFFIPHEDLLASADMSDSGAKAPSGEVPGIARVSDVSHLAALAYDVAAKDEASSKAATVSAPIVPTGSAPSQNAAPAREPQKVQVNTEGPVESDKIQQIMDGGGSRSKYDDYDDEPRKALEQPRPVRDRREDSSTLRDDDRRYLDREVKPGRWEGGMRYEVMINTSVMDRPSFHSREVAELYVGDRVLVDSRIGRWLKLRSVKGAPGYILAQDAEKLFD